MLETVREYALERLQASGEAAAAKRRLVDFSVGLVERAEREWAGEGEDSWLATLGREQDNLRAALAASTGPPGPVGDAVDAESALRLASGLKGFWRSLGLWSEGRRWLEAALALPDGAGPSLRALRAKALSAAANLTARLSDWAAARALWAESAALHRELGDLRGLADVLLGLGEAEQLGGGDRAAARALLEEGLALLRAAGDRQHLGIVLNQLGWLAMQRGEHGAAAALLGECVEVHRSLGDLLKVARGLLRLGELAQEQGDLDRAAALHEECLALSRAQADTEGIALALHHQGEVARLRGAYRLAVERYEESLALFRGRPGSAWMVARTQQALGHALLRLGQRRRAAALFRESLGFFGQRRHQRLTAVCLAGLAGVARQEGDLHQAARLLGAVAARLEALGTRLPAADQAAFERELAAVSAGPRAASLREELAAGQAVPLDVVLAHALTPAGQA
jgi:tetratricopeptide (TPR) repeat protein